MNVSLISGNSYPDTDLYAHIGGTLDGNHVFPVIDGQISTYYLTTSLTVPAGVTATLEPGTVLRSATGDRDIYVDGRLEATDATIQLVRRQSNKISQLEVAPGS